MLQGVAADCNSAEATQAWFDSRIAHHPLLQFFLGFRGALRHLYACGADI